MGGGAFQRYRVKTTLDSLDCRRVECSFSDVCQSVLLRVWCVKQCVMVRSSVATQGLLRGMLIF